jgi:hypothetical protein
LQINRAASGGRDDGWTRTGRNLPFAHWGLVCATSGVLSAYPPRKGGFYADREWRVVACILAIWASGGFCRGAVPFNLGAFTHTDPVGPNENRCRKPGFPGNGWKWKGVEGEMEMEMEMEMELELELEMERGGMEMEMGEYGKGNGWIWKGKWVDMEREMGGN